MRDKTNNTKDLEIIEELERLAMNESFIYDYDHEAVQKKIENSIRYEGIQEGERNKQIGIAKSMLRDSVDIKIISKYTGLSIKEVKLLM